MRSADDIARRMRFLNTGPEQQPTVIAAHLRGDDYPGAGFREVLYLVNVDTAAHVLAFDDQRGKNFVLHPVHRAAAAADRRAALLARYDASTGQFAVPARTAVVFVVEAAPSATP
jgi:pullulanase